MLSFILRFNPLITSSIQALSSRKTRRMATLIPPADLESFATYLKSSDRILALVGAGLSASSGLPTFRGAGGLWRSHEATSLATPEAFEENPGLVWQFYSYRRSASLESFNMRSSVFVLIFTKAHGPPSETQQSSLCARGAGEKEKELYHFEPKR